MSSGSTKIRWKKCNKVEEKDERRAHTNQGEIGTRG